MVDLEDIAAVCMHVFLLACVLLYLCVQQSRLACRCSCGLVDVLDDGCINGSCMGRIV